MQSAADVNLLIRSDQSASERRVNPSWTITHLKTRLEPITGIPSSSQRLTLKLSAAHASQPLQGPDGDDDLTQLSSWPLQAYAEIYVHDTRPAHLRTSYTDVSLVQKYEMPQDTYQALPDSVLAWKRSHQLGRFDPNQPSTHEQQRQRLDREIAERHIAVGARCQLLSVVSSSSSSSSSTPTPVSATPQATKPDSGRRGEVRFVGEVPDIPGLGKWVGVALDEPTGKHDGSVHGTRYFDCARSCGVFVRPERVEVGDFAPLDDLDDDMEEM